jgi:hypothetical protein
MPQDEVAVMAGTRSVSEIREHFIARLNKALLYPGMYGGELMLRQFLGDLAWMYSRLRQDARSWTAASDRMLADIIDAFGLPSLWRPKYNPRFSLSVGYSSESQQDPVVVFDLWQDTARDDAPGRSESGRGPLLRDVWWREDRFPEGFTFSPIGRTMVDRNSPGA